MLRSFLFSLFAMYLATTGQAGALSSILTLNGNEDRISTTSPGGLASVVKFDGSAWNPASSTLEHGDVIYGFTVGNSGVNDFLTGGASSMNFGDNLAVTMFSGQLVDEGGGNFNMIVPTASSMRLSSLVDSGFASDFSGFEDEAMFAMFSGGAGTPVTDPSIFADNTTGRGLEFFSSSDYDLEFLANTADDGFFQFFGTIDPAPAIGEQRAGLNVIAGSGDMGGLSFADVAIDSFFNPPATAAADIGVDTTLVSLTTNLADSQIAGNGWEFRTTSDGIRLNVVPEPTSILSFAGLALLGLGGARRRRMLAKV